MKKNIIRFFIYSAGMILMGLGTVLSIKSNLGITAPALPAYALTYAFPVSIGVTTVICYAIMIGIQLVFAPRSEYKKILIQIPASFLLSAVIDYGNVLLNISATGWGAKLLLLVLSLALMGVGVILSVNTRLVPSTPDGVVDVLSRRFQWKFSNVKNIFDAVNVLLGVIIMLIVRSWECFGLGTVASMLLVGRFVALFQGLFGARLTTWLFPDGDKEYTVEAKK